MFRKIRRPAGVLRLTLGAMYAYSGIDLLRNPEHWYGFTPPWLAEFLLEFVSSTDVYLRLQGAVELSLGLVFLAWFVPRGVVRLAALISAAEMALILLFVGVDLITFRDIPILGASLALFLMTFQGRGGSKKE